MSEVIFKVTYGDLELTSEPFGIEFGSDWGSPQSVSTAIASLLTDGEIETWQRDSNRTLSFSVLIEWADMLSASEAEASLIAEASRQRNVLVVDPGDAWGPPNVFDTFRAQVVWQRDDEMEQQGYRRFQVTMQAAPSVRSIDSTVVEAVATGGTPPTPSTVVVDTCSSATGWTGSNTVTSLGQYVQVASTFAAKETYLHRSGTIDTSVTNFIQVDWAYTNRVRLISAIGDGVALTLIAQVALDNGYTRATFQVAAPGVTELRFLVMWSDFQVGDRLRIDQVIRTNVSPFAGTGRQQFRALTVGGTARTEGSLQIAHDTDSLGEVLVFTNADDGTGYQPACRQYRVAGGTAVPDSTTASGAYSPLDAGIAETYDIPARTLAEGSYSILARVKAPSAVTALITATARTRIGSTDSPSDASAEFVSLAAGAWQIVSLGRLVLPPTAVPPGSSAVVRLTVASASRVDIDDLWICHTTLGAYSLVNCSTGTPADGGPFSRLWLDTATLDRPQASIWVGNAADRTDARHANASEIRAQGTHLFSPGSVNLFTVTSNALNAAASLSFFKRWHSNAAA